LSVIPAQAGIQPQENTLDSRVRGNDHPMVSVVDLHSRVHNTLLGRMNDIVEFTGGDLSQQMGLVL
jgi:hypothetical protein